MVQHSFPFFFFFFFLWFVALQKTHFGITWITDATTKEAVEDLTGEEVTVKKHTYRKQRRMKMARVASITSFRVRVRSLRT